MKHEKTCQNERYLMISTAQNGIKRKIFEENERFYYRFAKGALLLRGRCGFDSRREYQKTTEEIRSCLLVKNYDYYSHRSGFFCFINKKNRKRLIKASRKPAKQEKEFAVIGEIIGLTKI